MNPQVFMMSFIACLGLTAPCTADGLFVVKTIRAGTIITSSDIKRDESFDTDVSNSLSDYVGLEAKTTLFAGQKIAQSDVGPPSIIERNAIVELAYVDGGLTILVEGRALGRGAPGETIRAINMASRRIVAGLVQPTGQILVRNAERNK
jgi:flagella basal body P-ring formation protein FlgA